jgi:hypothetical protein
MERAFAGQRRLTRCFDSLVFHRFAQPAHLPRDVPEKAEAFLREALLPASCELLISVAICAWLAAPDQRKASFFQTHHVADMDGWRVVVDYEFRSSLRNIYAG